MADEMDIPIPGPDGLNKRIRDALGYAASVVEQEVGTNNGVTALYWAMHGIVVRHTMKRKEDGN